MFLIDFFFYFKQLLSYAPWCPACKSLKPVWDEFSKWSDDLSIRVASIDVTTNPGLSGRFLVTALPTIYHVKDGIFRQYSGSRDANTLTSYVEEKKWEKVDPVPFWKAPNSVQMSVTSQLFKMSMALRSVHTRLVDDYGIPNWGTYVLFALAIILFGVLLGLMIVCIVDIICPPRHAQQYDQLRDSGDEPVPSTSGKSSASTSAAADEDDDVAEDTASTSPKSKKDQ